MTRIGGAVSMTQMSLITPSYAPDYQLCVDLHRSVIRFGPETACHDIIVHPEHMRLFGHLAGSRTRIRRKADFLPRSFVYMPFSDFTVNLWRPFPPVRGWILQQLVKLAAVAGSEDDVVAIVDSDVEFVRPFNDETFVKDGRVRFYRKPGAVDEQLPRHILWHRTARSLLGLPPGEPPYSDYIASVLVWDPKIVRQMLARVTAVTGRHWATAIAGQLHFSESTLYGVFVDEVLGAPFNSFSSDDPLCLAYWGKTPLTRKTADQFIRDLKPTDVAAMISAKSGTSPEVRLATFAPLRAVESAGLHERPSESEVLGMEYGASSSPSAASRHPAEAVDADAPRLGTAIRTALHKRRKTLPFLLALSMSLAMPEVLGA